MMGVIEPVWDDPRVDRAMAKQWQRLASEGGEPVGWKLGLGTAPAMEAAATSGPLIGYLTEAGALPSSSELDTSGWTKPMAEPELAIHIGSELAAGASRDQAAAAIRALSLAVEIVDIDLQLNQTEELLAGNIFHRHYLLGDVDESFAGGRTEGITVAVRNHGQTVAESSDPEAFVGDLIDLTRHTADYLGAFGRKLEAGQFIISGSVLPPIAVQPGDSLVCRANGLGELNFTVRS